MKIKKIICVACAILSLAVAQVMPASATTYSENAGKRITSFTKEELTDEVWELVLYSNFSEADLESEEILLASIARYELVNFMTDYEATHSDVTVSDVSNEFTDYYGEKYSDIEFNTDENNNYYEYNVDNPDEKFYYTYDETTDQYICKNNDGKVIKTYAKYHYDYNGDNHTLSETESSSSAESEQYGNQNNSQSSGSGTGSTAEAVAVEVTTEQPTEVSTSTNEGMNSIQIIILVVLGVLLATGAVVMVVMLIQRKRNVK